MIRSNVGFVTRVENHGLQTTVLHVEIKDRDRKKTLVLSRWNKLCVSYLENKMANDINKPTRITEYEAKIAPEIVDDGLWVLLRYYDSIDWIETHVEPQTRGFNLKVLFQVSNGMLTREMECKCNNCDRRHIYNQVDKMVQRLIHGTTTERGYGL